MQDGSLTDRTIRSSFCCYADVVICMFGFADTSAELSLLENKS